MIKIAKPFRFFSFFGIFLAVVFLSVRACSNKSSVDYIASEQAIDKDKLKKNDVSNELKDFIQDIKKDALDKDSDENRIDEEKALKEEQKVRAEYADQKKPVAKKPLKKPVKKTPPLKRKMAVTLKSRGKLLDFKSQAILKGAIRTQKNIKKVVITAPTKSNLSIVRYQLKSYGLSKRAKVETKLKKLKAGHFAFVELY